MSTEQSNTPSNPWKFGAIIFLAVFAAIAAGVVAFAPDRLPSGIGLSPVQVEVGFRPSLALQGHVAMIENTSGKTLRSVEIVGTTPNGAERRVWNYEVLEPGQTIEIGWGEGWKWERGETLEVSAAGHLSNTWRFQ